MGAFIGQSITEIVLPKTVEIIEKMAFARCAQLTTVHLGANVSEIQERAFYDCTMLDGIELPATLTRLKAYAFEGCTSLTEISFLRESGWIAKSSLDESVYELTDEVFSGNTAGYLTGTLTFGEKRTNLMVCDWIIET